MTASEARRESGRVKLERITERRRIREGIYTDMDGLYAFILEQAKKGNTSIAYSESLLSTKAEMELIKNGFKLKLGPGIGGQYFSISW